MAARDVSPGLPVTDVLLAALAAAPFVIDFRGLVCDFADLPQRVFMAVMVPGAAAWWAARAAREGGASLKFTSWHVAAAVFLAWCGVTGVWSSSRLEWWLEWRHWLLAGAAGAVVAAAGGRASPWAVTAVFASATATAAVGLLQYLSVAPFSLIPQAVPPASTFAHRSFAMHWLVLGAPLGPALWARTSSPVRQWALALASGLIAGLAILASARAAWLGGAAAAALMFAWLVGEHRRRALPGDPRARWASAAAGVLLASSLVSVARSDYADRYGSLRGRLASMATGLSGAPGGELKGADIPANNVRMRFAIWRNAAAMAAERPLLGVGLGNFQVHYPWYSRRVVSDGIERDSLHVDHAHNDPYELLLETGLVGVLLALLVVLAAARPAALLLASEDPWDRALAAAFGAALAGLFVTSFFDFPFHRALPPTAVAVFLGVVAGRGPGRGLRAGAAACAAVAAVLGLAALALGGLGLRSAAGDASFLRANRRIQVLLEHPNAPAGMPAAQWESRRALLLRVIYEDARAAARDFPNQYSQYTLGSVLAYMGRSDEALDVLVPYTRQRPNHFRSLVRVALLLTDKGRLAEALQAATRAAAIRPESAKALGALGGVQAGLGRRSEAASSFARQGRALRASGDEAGAKDAFSRATSLDPGVAPFL